MSVYILLMLIGLEIKHFIADYLLQFEWMIKGKGSLSSAGGYVHSAIHVLGTAIVLAVGAVPVLVIAGLMVAEFVVHFALDYSKINYSKNITMRENPQRFWALYGLDQLLHHLTYLAIVYVVVASIIG